MATELAKAYVQIIPSAKGMQGNLGKIMDSEATGAGTSSGNSFASTFKKVIASAGIGLALKKVIGDAFSEGGELQQNLGGTEAVFGQFASTIQTQATNAYKNMGMSASEYMATANKMGSLFQGSGLEQQRALDLTSQAMQRAADVASVMGIDTSMAMESIAGAAKGNFTMMDNLGVAMNATTLQAYALEKGINFEWNTASNAEKAELAMQMFMERTTQYAGNFARESEETWSGSMGAMKSAYKDLMANIMLGNDLSGPLNNLRDTFFTFFSKNFLPAIGNIAKNIPLVIDSLMTMIVLSFNQASHNMDGLVEGGISIVTKLATGIITNTPFLLEAAVNLITSFASALINADWPGIANNFLSNLKAGMTDTSGQIFGNDDGITGNILTTLQSKLPEFLNKGIEIITNVVNGILQNVPMIITTATNMVIGFINGILPMLPQILQAGANLVVSLVNGIISNSPFIVQSAISAMINFITGIGQKLPEILQKGIEITGELSAGLIRAIPDLVSKIPQIIDSIKTEFTNVDWWDIGKNIINGIANGLANAGHMLWDAVRDVLGNFKDKVLDFFGIHSPSRWGEYVGQMISLGFPRGVENNLNPFRNAMDKLGETASEPLESVITRNNNYKIEKKSNNEISSKLDKLIEILLLILDKGNDDGEELKIYLRDREVARALREMGVVFE